MTKSLVSYDPETLREVMAETGTFWYRVAEVRRWIARRPSAEDELSARIELVVLLRMLGDLDASLDEARAGVERAAVIGERKDVLVARFRLAQTHQWRGEFIDSTLMFLELLEVAHSMGLAYESAIHEQAGKNYYEQGLWTDALAEFEIALELELKIPDRTYRLDFVPHLEMNISAAKRNLASA